MWHSCLLLNPLTLSQTSPWFTCLLCMSFENTVEKGEIARNEQFLLFPTVFSTLLEIFSIFIKLKIVVCKLLRPDGSVMSLSDSWPGVCEFDSRLRWLFFPACFGLSPLQKHVRKVVGGFGKKSCFSTGVRNPGNTYTSRTARIWP